MYIIQQLTTVVAHSKCFNLQHSLPQNLSALPPTSPARATERPLVLLTPAARQYTRAQVLESEWLTRSPPFCL